MRDYFVIISRDALFSKVDMVDVSYSGKRFFYVIYLMFLPEWVVSRECLIWIDL